MLNAVFVHPSHPVSDAAHYLHKAQISCIFAVIGREP